MQRMNREYITYGVLAGLGAAAVGCGLYMGARKLLGNKVCVRTGLCSPANRGHTSTLPLGAPQSVRGPKNSGRVHGLPLCPTRGVPDLLLGAQGGSGVPQTMC